MKRYALCRDACSLILLLMAQVAYSQPDPNPLPAGHLVGDVHAHAPHESTCQVILVPVTSPAPTLRAAQSNERFRINPTFAANITSSQRAVIQQAIDEWEAIVQTRGFTPAGYPIRFSNDSLSGLTLGQTTVSYYDPSGDLISATVVFDNDASTSWFIDPTPADDVEFDDTPPAGSDLLTVARHEIAHAIGWLDTPRVTSLVDHGVFDPDRLNIATTYPDSFHTNPDVHADDLMTPSIGPSTRRPISLYPDSALMARAFHYEIPARFVDRAYVGPADGSANAPWDTILESISLIPWGYHLFVVPGTYPELPPLVLEDPVTISAVRGGDVIIGGPAQP